MKSSIVRRELGCIKISQKWEGEALRAIKKMEKSDNILMQAVFNKLADYESERKKNFGAR